MRPASLLSLGLCALLGWAALPGASAATDCTDSPYVMDNSKTSADLNGVLASWSNTSCTGTILFTASSKTYQLNDTTIIVDGADWTLDASQGREITIVAAKDKKIINVEDYWDRAYLTVRGLRFKGNGTVPDEGVIEEQDGGCFMLYNVDFTAVDCIFDGFSIKDNGGGDGGALMIFNGRVILDRCNFLNNRGAAYGGAVEFWQVPYVSITDCLFNNNTAEYGGAALISGDSFIQNTIFEDNSATDGSAGALSVWNLNQYTIVECNFEENSASGNGGAIQTQNGASLSIYSTTFNDNSADGQGDDVFSPSTFICVSSCPAVTVPDYQCCTKPPTMAPTQAPTTVPTKMPTGLPTSMPTSAPTPLPTSEPFARVTTGTYCDGATTVPTGAVRRELKGRPVGVDASGARTAEQQGTHRALAMTPVQACYQACYDFYSPAPNNFQFLFQLVELGGTRVCQCCKTCETRLTQADAFLMEACVPTTALRLGPSISHKYLDPHSAKPLTLLYTLRVKGSAKRLLLRDMGVQVMLPPGAVVSAAKPRTAAVEGETVTWYPAPLGGTTTSVYRVKVTMFPPFVNATATGLLFRSQVFQNAYNLATAPYCSMPAHDTAVVVKTP